MTVWWYWALYALAAVSTVAAFWFFRWHIAMTATRLMRRIDVISERAKRRHEDLYWEYLRDFEAFNARLITFERARTKNPERFAALVSEGVPLADVIEAMAS